MIKIDEKEIKNFMVLKKKIRNSTSLKSKRKNVGWQVLQADARLGGQKPLDFGRFPGMIALTER